jgi:hypothetical protein
MKSPKPNYRKYSGTLRRHVSLEDGEPCELKNHYNGAMRVVVGYLDHKANQDESGRRFVYVRIENLVRWCPRYKGKQFSRSQIWKVIRELRARHVVSAPMKAFVRDVEMLGFYVAPHDALTERKDDVCTFTGYNPLRGHWTRSPEGVIHWDGSRLVAQGFDVTGLNAMAGVTMPESWYAALAAARKSGDVETAVETAVETTVETPVETAVETTVETPKFPPSGEVKRVRGKNGV